MSDEKRRMELNNLNFLVDDYYSSVLYSLNEKELVQYVGQSYSIETFFKYPIKKNIFMTYLDTLPNTIVEKVHEKIIQHINGMDINLSPEQITEIKNTMLAQHLNHILPNIPSDTFKQIKI